MLAAAAEGALTGLQSVVESLRLRIQNNRDVMMQELRRSPACTSSQAARHVLLPAGLPRSPDDSVELSRFLLKKALVVTVPGKEFGMEGHLRLSYCGTTKDVTEGVPGSTGRSTRPRRTRSTSATRKLVRDWL